jgi:hypothetical protein
MNELAASARGPAIHGNTAMSKHKANPQVTFKDFCIRKDTPSRFHRLLELVSSVDGTRRFYTKKAGR